MIKINDQCNFKYTALHHRLVCPHLGWTTQWPICLLICHCGLGLCRKVNSDEKHCKTMTNPQPVWCYDQRLWYLGWYRWYSSKIVTNVWVKLESKTVKARKSGNGVEHLSENTWRCHLVACYPPIWPKPEHINKRRGECLVSPISGFDTEDAPPGPASRGSKCENRATCIRHQRLKLDLCTKQARKPRSYVSSKLSPTHLLTGERWRATSIAKKTTIWCLWTKSNQVRA